MGIIQRLFGGGPAKAAAPSQAVLVHLDGQGLPDEVYEEHDLATLEDQLGAAIDAGGLGEYDGNDVGDEGATLYMYGPDAERLFAAIEATLRAYPLCKNARVVVRAGGPGAPEREVQL
jgi:hypothetical protein